MRFRKLTLAAGIAAIVTFGFLSGASSSASEGAGARALEGSWQVSLTPTYDPNVTGFNEMMTFGAGGAIVESNNYPFHLLGLTAGPGHGTWRYAVLEGRVQEEAGRLRVTLQLISAKNGDQLWSEQFDGQTNKLLALQDTISSRLRRDFSLADRQEQNNRTPVNSEAYEAYLKGRFLWNQRKRESYFAALDYFQKSIDADPNFAAAYTGISDSYHLLQQRNVLSTEEAFAKAETAAQKALELDPASPEAHTSMGSVSFVRYSRWTEAEQYFRGAIELNPSFAEPYARLGMLLNAWGRFDEAYGVLKKAESLDPTSVNNAIYLGAHFYFTKQYDRAELQFRRILEFAPGTERAHFFLARIYELNGRYEEAFEHHLKEREISRSDTIAPLRQTYQTKTDSKRRIRQ